MRFALLIVSLAAAAAAQDSLQLERGLRAEDPNQMYFFTGGAGGGSQTFEYVTTEMSFNTKVVKGAPYSAEAVTELTQTLSDGNRIHRQTKAMLYRDSEGRTRREATLGDIGPLKAAGGPIETIFINDPVAGANYVLDTKSKVARKSSGAKEHQLALLLEGAKLKAEARHQQGLEQTFTVRVPEPVGSAKAVKEFKAESLGVQMIEGVSAEGSRTVTTIAAGEIGNERPIEIVNERWYSPQLQTVVMTKRTDPFAGETVYKLTNIKLAEPPHGVFEVPADYTVKEGSQLELLRKVAPLTK
jgi:hypothetical protein